MGEKNVSGFAMESLENELLELFEIIEDFISNNSRNYKLLVLEKNKNNQLFCTLINFLFDSTAITNLSLAKFNQGHLLIKDAESRNLQILNDIPRNFNQFLNVLKNSTGKHTDIILVHGYISQFKDARHRELLKLIAIKELKLGIGIKTVVKVFPELIVDYNVMLAKDYYKTTISPFTEVVVTNKYDGIRMIIMINYAGDIIFRSKEGKVIIWKELEEELRQMMKDGTLPCGIVLDGELLSSISEDRMISFQFTQSCVMSEDQSLRKNLQYVIFDCIQYKEFIGICSEFYWERKKRLSNIKFNKFMMVAPVLYSGVYSSKIIEDLLNKAVLNGEEGIMINLSNAPYEKDRSNNLLKVKKFQDIDAEIIGVNMSVMGKHIGKMGNVTIRCTHENGKQITLDCGNGWTDELRLKIGANPREYIGKTIVVKFKDFTATSLKFPIFTGKFKEL